MNVLLMVIWVLGLLQTSGTQLRVELYSAEGEALSGQRIELELYVFESVGGETRARVWYHERCTTDESGRCTFAVQKPPPGGGMLYGTLLVGEQRRDVLWPGGDLYVPLRLDKIQDGREAEAFPFDRRTVVRVVRGEGWGIAILGALLLMVGVYGLYRKAKKSV